MTVEGPFEMGPESRCIFTIADTEEAMNHAYAIRAAVFVGEQECPQGEEFDGLDGSSRHIVGYVGETPVAVARWRPFMSDGRAVAKLERFAVSQSFRGRGIGRELVSFVIADAERAGHTEQYIHAQRYLESFYRTFGFGTVGEPFQEAGIAHVRMLRTTGSDPGRERVSPRGR